MRREKLDLSFDVFVLHLRCPFNLDVELWTIRGFRIFYSWLSTHENESDLD